MLSDKFMGRKTKYERAGNKLADELEKGLALCASAREDVEAGMKDPEKPFPVVAARGYLQMLANTVKMKLQYDAANKTFAEGLTAAQEQRVIIEWIVSDMTPDTRTRFMAKLNTALATGEIADD